MTIYFVRHGETEFNRLGIVQGSGVDTELNDLGQAQALAFYEQYRSHDFQLIVTSRLQRTHQTVRCFIEDNIPWLQTEDINEISWGDHEGQPGTPERVAVYDRTIAEWKRENYEASLPNGESARALGERVSRFIDWLKTRDEERILVCTHGRTMRCLVTLLKGKSLRDMEDIQHANTGCYVVRLEQEMIVFESENDTRHLETYMPV